MIYKSLPINRSFLCISRSLGKWNTNIINTQTPHKNKREEQARVGGKLLRCKNVPLNKMEEGEWKTCEGINLLLPAPKLGRQNGSLCRRVFDLYRKLLFAPQFEYEWENLAYKFNIKCKYSNKTKHVEYFPKSIFHRLTVKPKIVKCWWLFCIWNFQPWYHIVRG